MNIQDEAMKIHNQYGTSEMANYKLQLLTEQYAENYHQDKVKTLGLFSVSQRSELFFAVLKWAKQADLDYPDEMLLKDFEQFIAKNCG